MEGPTPGLILGDTGAFVPFVIEEETQFCLLPMLPPPTMSARHSGTYASSMRVIDMNKCGSTSLKPTALAFNPLVSKIFLNHLPKIFLFVEICIGFFGVFSGMLIDWIGVETTNYSQLEMVFTVYAFLAFPTLCMGMTLPILVEYLERNMKNIGKSVGTLYSINTLGSAVACIITAEIFFVFFGQTISLWIAAFFNLLVGYLVYLFTQSHLNSTA